MEVIYFVVAFFATISVISVFTVLSMTIVSIIMQSRYKVNIAIKKHY